MNLRSFISKEFSTALTKTKNDLQKIETDARNIIVTLKPFSFLAFAKKLIQKPSKGNSLEIVYSNQIEKIRSEKRVATATTYLTSFRSLSAFKPNLCFEDLSVEFLKDYEDWMLSRGRSITTVGIHMRTLRAVFNEAIYQEVISKEFYPFGKRRYQIPVGRNIKKDFPSLISAKFIITSYKQILKEKLKQKIFGFSAILLME
jgi:integrase/recombinase XerD